MDVTHAIVLGVVEGVTEFLPISSTGHLLLAGELLHIPATNFQKSFDIIIQLGAIFSVVVLYARTLCRLETLKKLVIAFIPTGIIGLTLYHTVKTYLLGNNQVVLWALGIGGLALIAFEFWHRESDIPAQSVEEISYAQAATIGLFQSLAIIPGVSRSAATIVGGMLLGLRRATIVEFSFLLAVPTMLAATGLDLARNASLFSIDQFEVLLIGFGISFVTALLSITFLLRFIRNHTFIPFGIYRIIITLVFSLVMFL